MPLFVYKAKEFDGTYENVLFDEIHRELGALWEGKDNPAFIIGNFNCQEKEIDAVFIKNNAIVILEFKNYGGRISFDNIEASHWKAGDHEVKCSYQYINPYRQVLSYKTIFGQTLEHILPIDHINVYHSHGVVVFNKAVEDISLSLSDRFIKWRNNDVTYNTWFHIIDKTHIGHKLSHVTSKEVFYSNQNLNKLMGKFKEHSGLQLIKEYSKSDITFFDMAVSKAPAKDNWVFNEFNKGFRLDELIKELQEKAKVASKEYKTKFQTDFSEYVNLINNFTIADEDSFEGIAERIYNQEESSYIAFLEQLNKLVDDELASRNLTDDKTKNAKHNFMFTFRQNILSELEEIKKMITKSASKNQKENIVKNLKDIIEIIYEIKSVFFSDLFDDDELDRRIRQKNNLLQLRIEIRNFLYLKHKESIEEIKDMLKQPHFKLISFLPVFLQIPPDSELYISVHDFLTLSLVLQKSLESSPFTDKHESISIAIKLSAQAADECLKKLLETKYIFDFGNKEHPKYFANASLILQVLHEQNTESKENNSAVE